MTLDWTQLTSPQVQKVLDIIRNEDIAPRHAFMAVEDFFNAADDETLYRFMVQVRLQLADCVITEEDKLVRKLDAIANHGAQSKTYMENMRRAFTYIEKENKPLPTPPT